MFMGRKFRADGGGREDRWLQGMGDWLHFSDGRKGGEYDAGDRGSKLEIRKWKIGN